MSKGKRMTLRQRMRADAEKQLHGLIEQAVEALQPIAAKSGLGVADLAKLITPGDHKTLEHTCTTQLANLRERELERIYNDQMGLPGVDHANEKE